MTTRVARATMLVRSPIAEVFDAFVNPVRITQFWLQATTGPLAKGAKVEWRFMVPGATEVVTVTGFDDQRRIAFNWSDGVSVGIEFREHGSRATQVAVEATGFGEIDEIVNATEGFSIVLCDLKTLLETGRSANLVRDKAELIAGSVGKTTK